PRSGLIKQQHDRLHGQGTRQLQQAKPPKGQGPGGKASMVQQPNRRQIPGRLRGRLRILTPSQPKHGSGETRGGQAMQAHHDILEDREIGKHVRSLKRSAHAQRRPAVGGQVRDFPSQQGRADSNRSTLMRGGHTPAGEKMITTASNTPNRTISYSADAPLPSTRGIIVRSASRSTVRIAVPATAPGNW